MLADETSAVVKGRRTKRQRLLFSPTAPPSPPPSSSYSSAESSGSTTVTEEEEDMANCLILLARGRAADKDSSPAAGGEKYSSYECKTCNKCFPSFQALGGHRASHKKPKLAAVDSVAAGPLIQNTAADATDDQINLSVAMMSSPAKLRVQITAKPKVHECSICGAEFSSGQALGGHMRRHRPLGAPATDVGEGKKGGRSFLTLDLNFPPAVADEDRPSEFAVPAAAVFADNPPMIFSAAPLVGCHY